MDMYDVILLSDRVDDGLRKVSFQTCDFVCSSRIDMELDGNVIRRIQFTDGCHGNTQGVAALCVGMPVDEVIRRLEGIDCHGRGTSCPDQLARALKAISL